MMAAPIWQPGTVYIPGDIVQPVSGSPAVGQLIVNPNFSGNATGWTLPAQFSYDGTTTFDAGTGSVRFNTVGNGFFSFAATAPVAVLPGTSIRATCMFQQGASDSGNLAGTVNLFWYDSGDVLIGNAAGNIINSGSGGQWHQSVVTAVAPAGAAFVRIGASANRVGQNLPAWFDHFTWNYVSEGVPEGLVYKAVQPASGVSGSQEPVWPSVLGVQVVDNTVTWEAIAATRVTWEASPAMVSGGTEPVWPTQVGGSVADGSVKWTAFSRRVEDVNCPNSKVVAIVASKVFAADGDIVRYCATANPLDWTTERDAGYLPTGLQQANANDMAVLNQYRANLVAFNASSFQNWQADPDPEVMAILDQMDGIGSIWQQAAKPVGNELFYLSQLGVRTVGIAGGSTNLQAGDVGMPVDPLVKDAIFVAASNGSKALATYYPSAGQYWLTFANYPPSALELQGNLPNGTYLDSGTYQYLAAGGVHPYQFSIVAGSLPPGAVLDPDTGLVNYTYTSPGSFAWTVRVTDAQNTSVDLPDAATVVAVFAGKWALFSSADATNMWLSDSPSDWSAAALTRTVTALCQPWPAYGDGALVLPVVASENVNRAANQTPTTTVVTSNVDTDSVGNRVWFEGGLMFKGHETDTDNTYAVSQDGGATWTKYPSPVDGNLVGIGRYNNGRWVAHFNRLSVQQAWYSDEAVPVNWTFGFSFPGTVAWDLCCDGVTAIVIGTLIAHRSTNGITWTTSPYPIAPNTSAFMMFSGETGVFIGYSDSDNKLCRSVDGGATWTQTTIPSPPGGPRGLAFADYHDGVWAVTFTYQLSSPGLAFTSADNCATLTPVTLPAAITGATTPTIKFLG